MNQKGLNINNSFKEEVGQLIVISVSVFLFILFFQPFPLELLVYDDRLLYVTGFGVMTFLLAYIVFKIFPILIPKWFKIPELESGPPFFLSVIFEILLITAMCFYVNFVGKTSLTLYILFKLVLICLLPLMILMMIQKNKIQEKIIALLREQNNFYMSKIQDKEDTDKEKTITFLSSNKSEKLTLKFNEIISIRSADNYIEVTFLENDIVQKKLLRNTLKNIEIQLQNHRNFIRCHRTGIVNALYIEKLVRSYSGYALKISQFEEKVPVSRQYLMQIKDALSIEEL